MRLINIVDGEIVFLPDPNVERIDELLEQLTKSVRATCKHPDKIMHNQGTMPDTGEWYRAYSCERCGKEWTEYDEAESA